MKKYILPTFAVICPHPQEIVTLSGYDEYADDLMWDFENLK